MSDFCSEQFIISGPPFSEAMIIPDDQGMGLKITDQELADIILSRKPGKFFRKGNDHQVVDALV